MVIFLDVGRCGAISIFKNAHLHKVITFNLDDWGPTNLKNKLYNWQKLLKKLFDDPGNVTDVGCFEPFGRNRKTIAHLAMLIGVVILHFYKQNIYLINEWQAWKTVLKQTKIPLRVRKKDLTIAWAQQTFQLKIPIDDNVADALLGGYFLTQNLAKFS